MVMHLTQCCCGCSLKTGTVIIGVLGTIGSLISFVVSIIYAGIFGEIKKGNFPSDESLSQEDQDKIKEVTEQVGTGVFIFCIVYAIVSAIQLILNIMLVFGASSEKPKLVKPWIVAAVITAVVVGIVQLIQIITMLVAGLITGALVGFATCAVAMCITVYFILVVNSFHTEMTSQHFSNKI